MVEDLRRDHQLVDPGALDESLHLLEHRGRGADRRACTLLVEHRSLVPAQPRLELVIRRRERAGLSPAQPQCRFPRRCAQAESILVGLGGEHVEPGHGVGLGELLRGSERVVVGVERVHQGSRREVRREGVRQSEHRGQLGTVETRPQDPDGDVLTAARDGPDVVIRPRLMQVALQLDDIAREVVGVAVEVSAKRERGPLVGAGRTAEPEIDASGIQRIQGAELFGDDERRVVRQHDAPGAHPDRGRPARDVADHHRGRCARDTGHVVMLRHPVPAVPERLGAAGEIQRVAHRTRGAPAFGDGRQIENGQCGHWSLAARRRNVSPHGSNRPQGPRREARDTIAPCSPRQAHPCILRSAAQGRQGRSHEHSPQGEGAGVERSVVVWSRS